MTADEKRQQLKQKIEAGEKRHEERRQLSTYAREAGENAVGFAREHPLATVAGAIAVGLLVGSLTPAGRRLGRRGGFLATALFELGSVYAVKLVENAGKAAVSGKDRLEDFGDSMTSAARAARREVGYRAGSVSDSARSLGKRVSRKTGRTLRDLKDRSGS